MTTTAMLPNDRLALANQIKELDDVTFPRMAFWNYDACEHHRDVGPQIDCQYRLCGGDLFSHQRVGTMWLYTVRHGLLASDPGSGKTGMVLSLLAILKERNELSRRAIIIPNTPAVKQWGDEAARWVPEVEVAVVTAALNKQQRIAVYSKGWDVLIIGSHLLINDKEILARLAPFDVVVNDDVDPILSHDNITARAVRDISKGATRSFTVNATPIAMKLQQLHAALVPAGGYEVFGSLRKFESRYVKTEQVSQFTDDGRRISRRQQVGYKNITELKEKVGNLYLRHKATELTDVRMPMLMPPEIEWLEMSPIQRVRYTELQAGVMHMLKEDGEKVEQVTALTQWLRGQQICAGLPALGEPDVPGASPKLDLLFNRLDGIWSDRKTIVFAKNVGLVKAAIERTRERAYDLALVWGQQNALQRQEQVTKFWEDPNCRFLIGTTSLERSLNLQIAQNVVFIDTHLNPSRVKQTIGRARRAGSPHERVFVWQFLMAGTQEENYLQVLRQRQTVFDVVFEEESEIFEALSPIEILRLMAP